jgi:hypothetical protein
LPDKAQLSAKEADADTNSEIKSLADASETAAALKKKRVAAAVAKAKKRAAEKATEKAKTENKES